MKKLLTLIIGLIISSMLGMTVSLVSAGAVGSLLDKVFDEADVNDTWGTDTKDLEKLSENKMPFENLYLFVYKNVVDGPKEAALKQLKSRTGYSKNDLEKIIFEGAVEPIINDFNEKTAEAAAADIIAQQEADQAETDAEFQSMISSSQLSEQEQVLSQYMYDTYYKPSVPDSAALASVLTQEYVLQEYTYITGLYEKEYKFQTENKKLAYEALASEMFMNNDMSDSAGIDLLSDLDLINQALFAYHLELPDREASPEFEEDEEVTTASEIDDEMNNYETNMYEANNDADAIKVVLSEEDNKSTEVILSEEAAENNNGDDIYTCFEDEELRSALDDYASSGSPVSEVPPEESTEANVDGGDETSSNDGAYETAEEEKNVDSKEEFQDMLDSLSGVPGDWTRGLPCNDVFCITINLVTENNDPKVDDYEESDSCIACHISYISQKLKDTLSKSLIPSKVSMNWFEDATCKVAGGLVALDLNVYAIPQPITLDPSDDTDDYAQERSENLQGAIEAAESRYGLKTQAATECESILNMAAFSSQTSFEEAMTNCEDASNVISANVQDLMDEYIFESQTQATDTLYEQVSAELEALLTYFQSFEAALKNSYAEGKAPLSSLKAKPYCQ